MLGGRYRVESELGRGGMAKVYRGEDTVLGRQVAVKILAPQFADDPNFVTRFRREAQAAARISNHNLVSVFDTGSDDGVHYIVMEYVEGRTLADFLAGGGRIMPERAIDIATHVCSALEAAHAQGVIHRDIKPGNIMLNDRGEVKVTDFGIARVVTTSETVAQTAAVLGTASYLSPEQAQGQPVDGRSDIYSLGCVLYEMVAGRPPFLGDSPVTVASKQVLEQPTAPSKLNRDVAPDLDAVILRALAKNPANRYQSAAEFRADLERVRRGLPVEATPIMAAPPAGATQVIHREPDRTSVLPREYELGPEPRSRWWVPVLVTLLILGVLGAVLFFLAQSLLNDDEGGPTGAAQVTVENVVGERLNAAREILEDQGLVVNNENIVFEPAADHPDQEPGTVLEQSPAAGELVDEGTEVILTVVEDPALVLLPTEVAGRNPDELRIELEALGLVVGPIQTEPSSEVEQGLVTRLEPPEGTEVEPESTVTIFVSSGPEVVTVPDVTCLSVGRANVVLREAGLVAQLSPERRPLNPLCANPNKVAAQEPTANNQVPSGTTVVLFQGEVSVPTGPTGGTGPTGATGDGDDG
jgi:serine/threonine-protein kinase